MDKYPKELSRGNNNVVIALSKTEAGKIYTPDTRVEISDEAKKMQYANNINGLVVKFIRIDIDGDNQILVMERLKHLDPRNFEVEVREAMFNVFCDEIKQLHKAGFCHRDIRRPSGFGGRYFDNVIITETGIRLVDVGISAIKETAGDILFNTYTKAELKEVEEYGEYILSL